MTTAADFEITPFAEDGQPESWSGDYVSHDGTDAGPIREGDVAEVLFYGYSGDEYDGKCAAVMTLSDGRFVAFETFCGPTGDGFHEDAYGGDADLHFASDLRLLVNAALTDEGRRIAGVPEELWNK